MTSNDVDTAHAAPATHLTNARVYAGNEAFNIYNKLKPDGPVLDLVESILSISYDIYIGPRGRIFLRDSFTELRNTLRNGQPSLVDFAAERRRVFTSMGLRKTTSYKEASLRRTVEIIGSHRFRGKVVDIGANDNSLGRLLVAQCPLVAEVLGVDIERRTEATDPPGVSFLLQQQPEILPIGDGAYDMAIIRYALHHMTFHVQETLLSEVRRILKPSGHLVIIEDTFSEQFVPFCSNVLLDKFLHLPKDQRLLTLACLDASSCLIEDERMPFAFTFRSLEEWQLAASNAGFEVVRAVFWGLPFFSLYQAPLGLFTFQSRP